VELVKVQPAVGRPTKPVISVCIANYQGEGLLSDCLDSVLQQRVDFSFEVIVHDDASTDGSLDLLVSRYPQVEVLISSENVGFCVANNRMVAHAWGEFVLLLNNDAALLPDALSTLLAAAQEQNPRGILTLPQFDWKDFTLVDRGCRLDPFYNPVPNLDTSRVDVAMVIGSCLWISRTDWQQLGGFPEWLGSIGEDLYLCCAARLAGMPVRALNSSGYRHRQGQTFGGNKPKEGRLVSTVRRRALSERNKTFALIVMTPTPIIWPVLILHLVFLAIEGFSLSATQKKRGIWREVYGPVFPSITRHRHRLAHARRTMQGKRKISLASYLQAFTLMPRKLVMLMKFGLPKIER
jgi:GT2 family glycosyltransferase